MNMPRYSLRSIAFFTCVVAATIFVSVWIGFDFASFFVCAAGIVIVARIADYFPEPDRVFLKKVMLGVFVGKIVLSALYYYASQHMGLSIDFFGDARGYSHNGFYIAYILNGKTFQGLASPQVFADRNLMETLQEVSRIWDRALPHWYSYRMGAFSYLIGFIYFLFGYSPLTIKLLNCLLSIATGAFIYHIARRLDNEKTAKISLLIYLFFPSLALWSITGLKDTLVIFLLAFFVYFLCTFDRLRPWRAFGRILLALVLIHFFNYKKFNVPIFAIVFCFFAYLAIRWLRRSALRLCAGLFLLAALIIVVTVHKPDFLLKVVDCVHPSQFASTQAGFVLSGGEVFKIYPEHCYHGNYDLTLLQFIASYAKGILYFFFSPYFFTLRTLGQVVVLPEMILWYIMLVFIAMGLGVLAKKTTACFWVLTGFLFVFVSMFCLVEGNIGTLFRHRTWLVPFFAIFCSVGLREVLYPEQKAA